MIISSKQFDKIKEVQVWFFQFLCRNFIGKGPALNIRVLLNLLLLEKKKEIPEGTRTQVKLLLHQVFTRILFLVSNSMYTYIGEEKLAADRQTMNVHSFLYTRKALMLVACIKVMRYTCHKFSAGLL